MVIITDVMVIIRCIGITDLMVMIQCNGNNGNNDIVGSNNEIITIVMVFWKVQRTDESQVTCPNCGQQLG